MRILFAGTPETAATVLRGLVASGHEVVGVLTREDAPVGRKKVLTESAVAQTANELGIQVIKANKITSEIISVIDSLKADLGVIVAYGVILKKGALEIIPNGWFNLHYSLLPKYRGAAPVQRALENGDIETGITIFKLDEGMDTGDVLATLPVIVQTNETAGDLLTRLNQLGVSLLNQELPNIYNGTFQLEQQTGVPTIAPKPTRDEARIRFSNNAEQILNQVRAFNPEPMAWCSYKGEPFRVLLAREHVGIHSTGIGELSLVDGKVVVGCGQASAIELVEVQPSSKKPMAAVDWYRGADHKERLN